MYIYIYIYIIIYIYTGLAHIGIFSPYSKLIKAHFWLSKHNRSQLPPAQRTTTTNSLSPFNQLTQLVHPINQSSPFNQLTNSSTQSIYWFDHIPLRPAWLIDFGLAIRMENSLSFSCHLAEGKGWRRRCPTSPSYKMFQGNAQTF